MKIFYWLTSLFILSFNAFAATPSTSEYYACTQTYALCTSAPCKPVPGSKDQSTCACIVQDGLSAGRVPCEARKQTVNAAGQIQLTSNFSLNNSTVDKVMTCTGNHAWTNCLDKPCIVDPNNSNQAICTCNIVTSDSFVTFGGECNTDSCSNILYSGATVDEVEHGTKFLLQAMHLTKSPMPSCPAVK
jgi:hypothetical protein